MKKASVFLFLLWSYAAIPQQIAQKKADTYFAEMSYASAVDYYKDLASGKKASEKNLRNLALCYFKLQDYDNASHTYDRLQALYPASVTQEDLFNCLQSLKSQARYSEANSVLEQLGAKNKGSLTYAAHKLNPSYESSLKKDSARYRLFNVESLNTPYSEFFPYVNTSEKQLLFVSNRRNEAARQRTFGFDDTYFTDVYAVRQKDSLHFSAAKNIREVESKYHDGPVLFSADGNTMYVTRTDAAGKTGESGVKTINLKLYIFRRQENGSWDKGSLFPYCSDDYSLGHAALSVDGKRLYVISDMPGGYGQTDLWCSEWKDGNWQKPVNVGSDINTEGQEMFPFINEQGILFYASNGYAGLGGLDICYAFPSGAGFVEGQLLGYPLNTRFDDFGLYVNPDLRTGYFSSNRPGGKGKDDIYYFNSTLPLFKIYLEGRILDSYSKKAVAGSTVKLLDARRQVIDSTVARADGSYHLDIPDPSKAYSLEVGKHPDYSAQPVDISGLQTGRTERDILVYPNYQIRCLVSDGEKGRGLDSVHAVLTDRSGGKPENFMTNTQGRFNSFIKDKRAGDVMHYTLKLEKAGYITSVQNFDLVLDTTTQIDLHKIVATAMEKMKKGADIGKIVKISPIYFDVAKWDIKPEAARELDKIVSIMNENPTMMIELGSHTDCRSDKAYNLKLSDKRAKASAAYIISKGIAQSRIYGKGYGESHPINACECEGTRVVPCTEEQHQQNRRTEFLVVKF